MATIKVLVDGQYVEAPYHGTSYYADGKTDLNFSVVGGSVEPSNPSENMIWVETDVEIADWAFSAEAPESPVGGTVWFQTGTTSSTIFNTLKKNNITVHPNSCKQYANGEWVDKTAKIYQGGAWSDLWSGELYKNGNEYTLITGGWDVVKTCNGTITKDASQITADCYGMAGKDTYVTIFCKNKIDLTEHSKLRINSDWLRDSSGSRIACFGVWNSVPNTVTSNLSVPSQAVATINNGNGTEVDIASLSGSYYVGYYCGYHASSAYTATGHISEVRLVK